MDSAPPLVTRTMPATPHEAAVTAAAEVIAAGGLVVLPTETVYGLAAHAASPAAVARLYAAKGRPASNPLIVHVADRAMAQTVAHWNETADALADAFWPGPLTLVLPARPDTVALAARADGPTVALRFPKAALMVDVAARTGPLVAPSANRSGRVSATSAAAAYAELAGRADLIVDAGPSPIGLESTVIDASDAPRMLRPGAITPGALEHALGVPLAAGSSAGALRSPGLLASHYAPRARLRLDVEPGDVEPGEAYLAFGNAPKRPQPSACLSRSGDLHEAARHLYASLRALDETGVSVIAVAPIPAEGLGIAIRDRLARAAAPRATTEPQAKVTARANGAARATPLPSTETP